MVEEVKKSQEIVSDQFLVVGVGASAGGLDAFKQLVQSIPSDSGIAYILIQHLDRTHESILSELLQKVTTIPVQEISNNLLIEANHIYVVPPNKLVTVEPGVLKLTDRSPRSFNELPIDLFFNSLADVYQSHASGIILSGTGKDGTLGLRSIKSGGGITFAQHHETASYNEMPQHAINSNVVDFVLSPDGIVRQLLELNVISKANNAKEKGNLEKPEDITLKKILSLIDLQKGVDFTYYKQSTLQRRISRRIVLRNFPRIEDYLEDLKTNTKEVDTLFQDILIPVTEFFRDQVAYEYLTTTTLPALVASSTSKETFRAWCVGCSTGQEAYSIAICLFEFFENQSRNFKLQVFATDISDKGISQARSGFYSTEEVTNVSPERLSRFFIKSEGGYQVNKAIWDICVFATHNLLTSPPFASINLISCRNVLIYMEPFLQRKAMATFHYSLNDKGMLFLGKSESIGNSSDLFSTFSESDKFYNRNSVPGRFVHISAKRREEFFGKDHRKTEKVRPHDDFQKSANDLVLLRAPAGVIVNEHLEIIQFRGTTGEWLESAPGKPSVNVLKMAKRGLSLDLRNALQKAKTTRLPIVKEGIVLDSNGIKKIVTIEVVPILDTINLYYLILFRNSFILPYPQEKFSVKLKGKANEEYLRSLQLEKELSQTREDMRTITEDQEAGNEELLSANEELLSGSEELRSLNEELEISKEELQSTVEELSVSNQELTFRNDELNYSRNYSEAIITTINEPLIVLTKDLRIKSANDAFFRFFNLSEQETTGQNFFELDNNQWEIPELRRIIDRSLHDSKLNIVFELKCDFRRIGQHVILIKCRKIVKETNSEPLLLLIIENITERRRHEDLVQTQADYSRLVLDSSPIITSTASPDGLVTYSNKCFLTYSGLTLEQAVKQGWSAVIHPDQNESITKAWLESVATESEFNSEMLLKKHDGTYRWHFSHALPIRSSEGKITSWVCSSSDIHDQKMFSRELERQISERTQSLKESNIELEHSNKNLEQFVFIASHDLQEPLRKIQTFSSILVENASEELSADARKLLDKIHASSARLSVLIHDILNFSRINHTENAFKITDLDKILKDVLDDFSLLIEEKKATVNTSTLPGIEVIPIQINQLFYNLLNNSLKFISKTELPVINISHRNLARAEVLKFPDLNPSKGYFEILFSDNGIGFDVKFKDKIFEIFQRLHQRDEYPGTGIGLALCQKIVANHRGLIFADSEPGTGALFHIILPLNEHHSTIELLPGYEE
jgi:two-component system, chemotaxis family, CheB/CheR fusion protein